MSPFLATVDLNWLIERLAQAAEGSRTGTRRQPMRKPSLTLLLIAAPALAVPSAALAVPDDNVPANCWGVVTSQFAKADRGIGEHASNQTNPRLGLGNVARALYEAGLIDDPHVSDLGALLAQLDEFDETVCPVQ